MSTSLVHARVGPMWLIVQSTEAIIDAEWDLLMEEFRVGDHQGVVVIAAGPPPNSRQRNLAREAIGSRSRGRPPVALVSNSVVVRSVVSTLNLFMGDLIRFFAPSDLAGAFQHALLDPKDHALATDTIRRLKEKLAQGSVA